MDPPSPLLLHPWCILSWNSRNLSKQLLFDSGSSSPGAVFLLPVDLGLGAAVGGMGAVAIWYVTIPDTRWRCSQLLNLTVILHSLTFLSLSVFVFVFPMYLSLSLSFLSLLWVPWYFTNIFRLLPLLLVISEIYGVFGPFFHQGGWREGEGVRGLNALKYQNLIINFTRQGTL